jgi:hypothetical protein
MWPILIDITSAWRSRRVRPGPDPSDPGKEIVYVALEGGEAGTYVRGTGQLNDGKAVLALPEHFRLVTAADTRVPDHMPVPLQNQGVVGEAYQYGLSYHRLAIRIPPYDAGKPRSSVSRPFSDSASYGAQPYRHSVLSQLRGPRSSVYALRRRETPDSLFRRTVLALTRVRQRRFGQLSRRVLLAGGDRGEACRRGHAS